MRLIAVVIIRYMLPDISPPAAFAFVYIGID